MTSSSFIKQNCQIAGKEREICNWKEVTESNNLNISTHDSDMGTGYGDGDVEDAYHAIFGEEKKCTKGQRGSNISTEPSPTSGSCCNVDNVLDAAAAALSGSKRDRKGRPLEVKKEDDSPVLSKPVKNEISSFSVGKVVIITSGEYCDWEGEILCIETSQSYPKSTSKSKQSEAFYVVALQYSDGSPLDCCVLVSHSMITSSKFCSSNEVQLDDISDDSDMADSTMKYTATSHCSTAPLTLDFPPKPPKLSFQISPIRPGRNDKSTDKDNDKSNNEKGDISSCDKLFSEECIEIVEAFTADLVQSQIDSEIVFSVFNEIKTNIEVENTEQIKNENIHKNDMNKNSAGRKGVNDSMCEKDIEKREIIRSIPDDTEIDLDVTDKCESSRNCHFLTNEEKEIFPREGIIVRAEEKAEHEKLKTEAKAGISNIVDTATERDSRTTSEIGSVDSAEVVVAVAVEEIEIVTDTAITGETMVTLGDEVSGGSDSGLAVLSEISVNIDKERNGLISNSVVLTVNTGAENVRDNDCENSHSNDNTISISNSMNENDNENDSDAPLQPLSSSQIRYQQYAALRPLDMSTVGRRVRITAAGNKHRYANCI